MAKILTIQPETPQKRLVSQLAEVLAGGGIVAFPTETSYVLACHLSDKKAQDRLRRVRQLSAKHELTLICRDLHDIGSYAKPQNYAFRLLKKATPGPYTFILKATKEIPNRLVHPNKKTIGIRVSEHPIVQATLDMLREPVISSSLILFGEDEPLTCPYEINEQVGHQLDMIIDGGGGRMESTSVIDLTGDFPLVIRQGQGDVSLFA